MNGHRRTTFELRPKQFRWSQRLFLLEIESAVLQQLDQLVSVFLEQFIREFACDDFGLNIDSKDLAFDGPTSWIIGDLGGSHLFPGIGGYDKEPISINIAHDVPKNLRMLLVWLLAEEWIKLAPPDESIELCQDLLVRSWQCRPALHRKKSQAMSNALATANRSQIVKDSAPCASIRKITSAGTADILARRFVLSLR